jgi:dihydroflavonol-4-reductase
LRALVTGATGFVGYYVAKALREMGLDIRALVREDSDADCLKAIDAEPVRGDVRDMEALSIAVRGCDQVYHVAADYRLWVPDPKNMYETNVQGTINVMEAAFRQGVERVVYTSTAGALAPSVAGIPTNEETPVGLSDMTGHYKRSKFLAEQAVRPFVHKGLPVVIVNPTTPIGAMDRKPTPTGKIVVDFLNGRMPAYVDTGLNFVDVEDVAAGHVAAAQKGAIGEKYVLGNKNLTLKQFLHMLARLTGKEPPRWKLPYGSVLCAAAISEGIAKLTPGRAPLIPLTGVRIARRYMFVDCSKAVGELGLPQNSLEIAAQKAIDWYNRGGYVLRGRAGP